MNKFSWIPTECAPEKYPIEIYRGHLIYENGDSIYIPNGKVVKNGWGNLGSIHVIGEEYKPIPTQLNITWLSFAENKFYSGRFDLPKEEILRLFETGFTDPYTAENSTYSNIVVGLAPGGLVVVWLAGAGKTVDIGCYKAKETYISMEDFAPSMELSRDEYINFVLENKLSPEDIADIKIQGIPFSLWHEYRVKYNWDLSFNTKIKIDKTWIHYYNGEKEVFSNKYFEKNDFSAKAIPAKISLFYWTDQQDKFNIDITFNEKEIFKAVNTLLSETDKNEKIMLTIKINKLNNYLECHLKNTHKTIKLIEVKSKMYQLDN